MRPVKLKVRRGEYRAALAAGADVALSDVGAEMRPFADAKDANDRARRGTDSPFDNSPDGTGRIGATLVTLGRVAQRALGLSRHRQGERVGRCAQPSRSKPSAGKWRICN